MVHFTLCLLLLKRTQVVHGEGPLQFLVELAPGGYAERHQELSEVDCPVSVGIERPEDVFCELRCISIREEVTWKTQRQSTLPTYPRLIKYSNDFSLIVLP